MKKDKSGFDRNIPLIPAVLFIASIFLSLLIYMQGIPRISDPFVSHIMADTKGQVWAVYNHYLLPIPAQKTAEAKTPLSFKDWDIERHIGYPIALQNGGWLINQGGQNNSFWHNVLRYWHIARDTPESEANGSLLQCDHQFTDCSPWGDKTLHFNDPWGGLELADGRFIISDVSRHKIHLVSTTGKVIHTLSGFRFPNHIELKDGQYWVVDTNRNRLKALNVEQAQLSLSGEEILFSDYDGIAPKHRFPSIVLDDQTEGWWLMAHNPSMANAGLYHLNENKATRFANQLNDIIAIYHKNNTIWAADLSSNQLYQVDINQGATAEPEPLSWLPYQEVKAEVETQVSANFWSMLMNIAAVLAVGIACLVHCPY